MADSESNKPENDYADDFVARFMKGNTLDDVVESDETPALEPEVDRAGADQPLEKQILEEQVIMAMRQVYDPELPVNIFDLGLIYKVEIDDNAHVSVDMTLTTPGCPVAQTFPGTVENAVKAVEGVASACVELVWDPPWTKDRISEAAKLELGLF